MKPDGNVFRITARTSPDKYQSLESKLMGEEYARVKGVCEKCEHLSGGIRCVKPCNVCPRDSRRVKPWERMPRCPAGKW